MAFRLVNVTEGVVLAFDAMRGNKLRSALTILGVVIGVTTVMVMASLVDGIRSQIFATIANASPRSFYVMRFYSSVPLNPERLPAEVRVRPVLSESDAEAALRAPGVQHAGLWVQVPQRIGFGADRSQGLMVYGADNAYLEVQGGTLLRGRWFSRGELKGGGEVFVIEQKAATRLLGTLDPIGRVVRIGAQPFTIVGVFAEPDNIFAPPGAATGGVIPYRAAHKHFRYDETNGLFLAVLANRTTSVAEAQDAAIVAIRHARGLRPSEANSFDLLTQDKILETINNLTSAFFMVMIALSSVALLVGGIGVMAIMMVSVSDRTREIGIRKALGATHNEILWQFLVEAATLTAFGGLLGIAMGMLGGELLKGVLNLQSGPPLWSALIATGASVTIGLVFGVIPANRAARMDPVEALRYE